MRRFDIIEIDAAVVRFEVLFSTEPLRHLVEPLRVVRGLRGLDYDSHELAGRNNFCERCAKRFDTAFKSWHSSFLTIIAQTFPDPDGVSQGLPKPSLAEQG